MIYSVPHVGRCNKTGRVKILTLEATNFADEKMLTFLLNCVRKEGEWKLTIESSTGEINVNHFSPRETEGLEEEA